ncbi:MAG: EAL domain-containing protein [Acidimicrobiia bacterium]|nr:EAL domain-containing protein [Acidimicrobiia bacterium]MBV8986367.1 EAL domain-containing protein [Acidimicrobiia bacterium]
MATATGRTARTHAEDDNALFHAHPQPAWVCDPATGAILDVNAAAVQAYGYDRPAFLAMRIDDVVAARLGDLVTHHRKRNGDVIDVKQTASSVVINGRVARMIVAVDVTEERERERALLTSEKRLRDLIDATSAVVYVKALDGRYVLVNQRYEELTGFSRDQVLGRSDAELWPAPFAAAIRANDLRVLDALEPLEFEEQGPEENALTFLAHKFPLFDPDGVPYAIAGISTDITLRKRAEESLRRSEERFRLLAENADDFIFRYRLKGEPGFDYVSPACVTITGYTAEELYSDPRLIFNLIEAMHVQMMRNEGRASLRQAWDVEVTRKDGSKIWVEQRLTLSTDESGEIQAVEGIARDVTARKDAEGQLAHQALHDSLTGLPNRRLLIDRVEQALARVERDGTHVGVLLLDLDRFKLVNDSWGHSAGDEVLVAVSERLSQAVRNGDTVARFGGDEFVVVREGVGGAWEAARFGERLLRAVTGELPINGEDVYLGASLGIAVGSGGDTAEALLRDADAAMYSAKERGRGRVELFDADARGRAASRLAAEAALRRAVERDEFVVLYQPIVSVDDEHVVGAEALVRWDPPGQERVSPTEFIPVAEETGLIVALGQIVLDKACDQLRQWQAAGLDVGTIAVNLSAKQLSAGSFSASVSHAMRSNGLSPGSLSFEITESVLMEDVEFSIESLVGLKALGVRLAVDDFGTGYSSLAYLKRLPLDTLKVDRAFVDGLGTDPNDSAIVAAIVALAGALGLKVVAEGVETDRQMEELRRLGCDRAQGYRFAKPLSAEDFEEYIRR